MLKAVAAVLNVVQQGLTALSLSWSESWWFLNSAPVALLLAAVGGVLLFAPSALRLWPLGLLAMLPLGLPTLHPVGQGLAVTVLDVGQGLAMVLRTPNHAMVFDAGPKFEDSFDAGASVVVPAAVHLGVRQLDALMVSHADNDHAGGAVAVRNALKPRQTLGYQGRIPCQDGLHWQWDAVQFSVLNGPRAAQNTERKQSNNNGSCVLKVVVGRYSVLIPADIEAETEATLLAQFAQQLHADVLIAPHHGSKTSSSNAFVEGVNPDIVIFSAGFANAFRHPRPEVVARYQALGAEMYMTGHQGGLTFTVDPNHGVSAVTAQRDLRRHYWQADALALPGAE